MLAALLPLAVAVAAIIGLPLLGAIIARQPLSELVQLPLNAWGWDALPFDPEAFWASVAAVAGVLLLTLWMVRPRSLTAAPLPRTAAVALPLWGWLGVLVALGAAGAASTTIGLPLLFLGLALLLNADTERRTGSSLLTKRPAYFAVLFPASAVFGWLYYYLNLYLQLWIYPSAGSPFVFSATQTVCYAVLLPTLLSLRQWLGSFPLVLDWCSRGRPVTWSNAPEAGWILLGLGCFGLVGAAIWRDWIYPITWIAPLLLALGIQRIRGRSSPFAAGTKGDWSRMALPAVSALGIGVIAQSWNSLAGPFWVFSLPLIDAGRVMGLAAPAYAGLLPLGLLGIWVADQLASPWRKHPLGRFRTFPIKLVIRR
ncbi:MAG: hypothetical protein WCA32_02060 [Chromatiaceae bacterium]